MICPKCNKEAKDTITFSAQGRSVTVCGQCLSSVAKDMNKKPSKNAMKGVAKE